MTFINPDFSGSNIRSKLFGIKTDSDNKAEKTAEPEETETKTGELEDKVDLSSKKEECFKDVLAEMQKNVPDTTSTIAEKRLAISYINRMLNCSDITGELKTYWENKKVIIEQEIQGIRNDLVVGSGEKVDDVVKEYEKFVAEYNKTPDKSLSAQDKNEFKMTYYETCLSFMERILACTDLTDEQKSEWETKKEEITKELKALKEESSKAENDTPSFFKRFFARREKGENSVLRKLAERAANSHSVWGKFVERFTGISTDNQDVNKDESKE